MSVKASSAITLFDVSDGTGVKSITDEYYLSTSKTEQTGGSWSTTPPTWSSGKYLWTRSIIVYENPDSTVYTTPMCDSSWEAVNEVTIGGRNYIRNGNFSDEIDLTTTALTDGKWILWGAPTTSETVTENSKNWTHIVTSTSDTQWQGLRQSLHSSAPGISFVDGEELTLSAQFKTEQESEQKICLGIKFIDADDNHLSEYWTADKTVKSADGVCKTSNTVTTPAGTDSVLVYVGSNYATTDAYDFYFTEVQLEKGCKATDWTPAVEDMVTQSQITVVQNDQALTIEALSKQMERIDNERGEATDKSYKEVNTRITLIEKYFTFSDTGLTIKTGDSTSMQLVLNNDRISFRKNGVEFGWWDGDDFHTGNIDVAVDERAKFGNFAFVPRSDGSLSFLKVGE